MSDAIVAAVRAITTEATDDDLNLLVSAVNTRRKTLRSQRALVNQASLDSPGTRVVTVGLSPKYLSGLHGTVVPGRAHRAGDILVKIDEADQHFVTGRGRFNLNALAVPASALKAEE